MTRCEYFERYGDSGNKGLCENAATLALAANTTRPVIQVCTEHANVIVSRYPELGSIEERFVPVEALDEFGRVPRVEPEREPCACLAWRSKDCICGGMRDPRG